MDNKRIENLCKRIRYSILTSTTQAGSGHTTSSLSAVELIATLFFGGFLNYDLENPHSLTNDRVIFSKGHAAPLLYALYEAAGAISQEEMQTLRSFSSRLQGHPTPEFPFVDVATGSLGQGLSMGVGMAIALKKAIDFTTYRFFPKIYVLLGDSEMAEGQVWEALQIASYYKLNNLIGILDVNRLGQRGETMLGWDLKTYERRISSFGWNTIIIEDGHDINEVNNAFSTLLTNYDQLRPTPTNGLHSKPTMLIAKTIKGKGYSGWEDKNGWHSKPLAKEELPVALKELGEIDWSLKGEIKKIAIDSARGFIPTFAKASVGKPASAALPLEVPMQSGRSGVRIPFTSTTYGDDRNISTKEAYGKTLVKLGKQDSSFVVFDADVANSTHTDLFQKASPDRFYEMFIAEQNMVSTALGFATLRITPFVSVFSAFLTRAFDQIRMSQYSFVAGGATRGAPSSLPAGKAGAQIADKNLPRNMIFAGSYAGVSVGKDGPSGMGLEDIAMMRSIRESTILYPSDAVSTAKLTSLLLQTPGISYIRLTREKTPVIYNEQEEFRIGGCKVHYSANSKQPPLRQGFEGQITTNMKYAAVIIAAGITLHEAIKAQKQLAEKGTDVVVIDLYSVKPLDEKTILKLAQQTNHLIVVEDHYPAGGIGEAIAANIKQLSANTRFSHLCVQKTPRSGTSEELLRYEEIDAEAIIRTINAC